LFGKFLIEPLGEELRSRESLIDILGVFRKPEEVVEVDKHILGKLDQEVLEKILGKKILDPRCKNTPLEILRIRNFEALSPYFESIEFLKKCLGNTWRDCWRQFLEGLAEEWRRLAESTRSRSDYKRRFPEGEVCIGTEEIKKTASTYVLGHFRFVHSCLMDEEIFRCLKNLGVREISMEDVTKLWIEKVIPRWLKDLQNPFIHDLMRGLTMFHI